MNTMPSSSSHDQTGAASVPPRLVGGTAGSTGKRLPDDPTKGADMIQTIACDTRPAKYRHWFLLLAIALVATLPYAMLAGTQTGQPIVVETLNEVGDRLGIDDVLSAPKAEWREVPANSTGSGQADSYRWFRWQLPSAATGQEAQHLVEIANPHIDEMSLFAVRRDHGMPPSIRQWDLGDRQPFSARPYAHRNWVVPIAAEAGSTVELFARVRSAGTQQLPVRTWKNADFQAVNQANELAGGLGIAIILVVLGANLLRWLTLGERIHLYFVLWAGSLMISLIARAGIAFQYLWPDSMYWNDHALIVLQLLGTASAIGLALEFVAAGSRQHQSVRHIAQSAFAIAFLLLLLHFMLPDKFDLALGLFLAAASTIVPIACGIHGVIRQRPAAAVFLAGFATLLVITAISLVQQSALVATAMLPEALLYLGYGIAIIVVSLALAVRRSVCRQYACEPLTEVVAAVRPMPGPALPQQPERRRGARRADDEALRPSLTDPLTGLPDHRHFRSLFASEAARAATTGHAFSVAMIDIDRFELFETTYGQAASEQCLRAVARELRRQVPRDNDLIARYGGETFCVILPNTDADGAMVVAERIRRSMLGIRIDLDDAILGITVSIGVHTVRPGEIASGMETLLHKISRALCQAKNLGRNCVVEACAMG